MLQIQNQASADTAGLPKGVQFDEGTGAALLGSFAAPHRNEKLLHTDQKGKPIKPFGLSPDQNGMLDTSQSSVLFDQGQISMNVAALQRFQQHQQ